ncbi:MAG: hypothetical protein CMK44_01225 [Porticoccus sp.]|nr:hypothetical protein [Porticoccus sp.]|tara:strand:+ start:218 stop:1096 length:879 start_codon:yes stop_codon:yes gene_type:complete
MSNNSTKPGYDDSYANQVNNIIDTLELDSETDRGILKSRFLSEVVDYERRKLKTKKYYDVFRFIVTTGSILLPAILSLGQMDPAKLPKNFDQITYWSSWTISLMVTASNGFLQLFSLDKNYFEYALTTEQLKTEGWQFFQLSGKYEDDESHQEAYKDFSKSIENIKRKQVEKEYSGKGDVNKNKKGKKFDFQAELMKNLPDELKKQIPDKPKPDVEEGIKVVDNKMHEIDDLMNDKMGKLDVLMGMLENKKIDGDVATTVGNVREILKDSIKEQVSEAATEAVNDTIDNVVN